METTVVAGKAIIRPCSKTKKQALAINVFTVKQAKVATARTILSLLSLDKLSKENQIEKLHLKIKRYSSDEIVKLDAELLEEIDIEDANKEDFIISKIDELKKPEEIQDLTDNIFKK